jgi:hypothetical protein
MRSRSQKQPESQSIDEYVWPSASASYSILIHFRSDTDLTSKLIATRAELASLQERYDALHADRDRLAQTLAENMKKYKRFERYIITMKRKVPPKKPAERDDEMRACSSSTPGSQQQFVVKMLETPVTPMSLCPISFFFLCFCAIHLLLTLIQNLD